MTELAVHTEIHVREQFQRPICSTCRQCHRSFRAKCEDQLSLELCDPCFDALRHEGERAPRAHVVARAQRSGARR